MRFSALGVGNSFQALQDGTAYTYLVNAHWSLEQKKTYTFVNLADPELNIQWPIPLEDSERSEADLHHPMLKDAKPMAPKRTMVFGSNGKLGRAIRRYAESHGLHGFEYHDTDTFDEAETPGGRKNAWRTNVQGVKNLARIATEHRITLVHISSDYVFDGTKELHTEDEEFAPLGVYGQTKAAGDALVENVPQHYLLRSSWVIGEGRNFVTRMLGLAQNHAHAEAHITRPVPDASQAGMTLHDSSSKLLESIPIPSPLTP